MTRYVWPAWEPAVRCTAGPTDGALAFLAWALETEPAARSLGIYNCRTIRGGTTTSLHGEGRAVDVGFPVIDRKAHKDGYRLLKRFAPHARRLGIQLTIWDRTIWGAKSPSGRPYYGIAPHLDHLHVELTRKAAAGLTLTTIRTVTGTDPVPPKELEMAITTGDRGPAVALIQACLVAEASGNPSRSGPAANGMPASRNGTRFDGIFGPEMAAAVKAYQAGAGIPVTGQVDGITAALLVRYASDRHG